MTDIARFRELFVHRDDIFAEQMEDGSYRPVRYPITDDDIAEHLDGWASFGVYVIKPVENTVKYLVFDLDTEDELALEHLVNCCNQLLVSAENYGCLLLEHSGNKGWHVWLFFDTPVSAAHVRNWLRRDFAEAWMERARVMRWPLEVFPKQDGVPEGGFGNLVKLPLGVHAASKKKSQIFVRPGWAESISDVVPLATALLPSEAELEGSGFGSRTRRQHDAAGGPSTPYPCMNLILREGVGSGIRNNAIFHLATYLYGRGIDEDLATEQCIRANEHFDPPLTEDEVRERVRSAYSGRYAHSSCRAEWLRGVCPGPCENTAFAARNELGRAQPGDQVTISIEERHFNEGRVRLTIGHPDAENHPTLVVKGAE